MKTVFITGCSTGIGHALAASFVRQGCTVYATARRIETLAELADLGCRTLALDVNDAQSIAAAVAQVQAHSERVDILINNAGYAAMGPLAELPPDVLRAQFETNVIAPIAVTQALLGLLGRGSRVIDIGSVSGILTTPFAGAYCATKAALHALDEALRMELAPLGIAVITVQPGGIASNFSKTAGSKLQWLREDSRYAPIRQGIEARVNASQSNPTSATEFAAALVDMALATSAPPVWRFGNGSRLLPFLRRYLPRRRRERMLSRRFGLHKLED